MVCACNATSNPASTRRSPQDLAPLPGAEVVLRVENKTPSHDLFSFHKLKGGLMRAGRYVLE
jgi:hypothetical protein